MHEKRTANFTFLLVGLLAILIIGPLFHEFTNQAPMLITQIGFAATLIIGIWSLIDSRRWFIAGIILAAAELVATAVSILHPSPLIDAITLMIALSFCTLSLVFCLRHVVLGKKVTVNRIIGAICAYLLLGFALALLNMMVLLFIPESYSGLTANVEDTIALDMIYYTFVTLTTLGYGDITPASPLAKALAYMAATVGQFYIAILIGMLVGAYMAQSSADTDDEAE